MAKERVRLEIRVELVVRVATRKKASDEVVREIFSNKPLH